MTASALSALLDRLRQVQKLRSTRYRIVFLCTLLGVFGFMFLAFSMLDIALKMPPAARAAASSACLLAWLVTLAKLIQTGARERREAARLAAEIERVHPQLETALSTSVEFGADPDRTERLSSPAIVDALVEHTKERAEAVNFLAAVNWRRAQAALVGFLIIVAVCGFYSVEYARLARLTFLRMVQPWKPLPPPTLTIADVAPGDCEVRKYGALTVSAHLAGRLPKECRIEYAAVKTRGETPAQWRNEPMTCRAPNYYTFQFSRLTESFKFRVLAGDFKSKAFYVDVFEPPRIVRINMTLTYPDYCGLKPKEIKDSIGPITALRGTRVRIHAFANKPLRRAGVRFYKGKPGFLAASLPAADEMTAEFTITQNDRYKIWLADAKGRVNEDAVFYTIKALDDQRPVVVIKRPKKDLKARKTTEVDLQIEASDDYGIQRVGIAYKIKTDEEKIVTLREFKERLKEAKLGDTLFLEEMGLADTDIVTYYAFAIDNDTVSGPKVGRSALHFIEITPYAMQYKKEEKKGGGKKKQGDKKFIPKLENIIKKQKQVLADTFGLNNALKKTLSDEQAARMTNLGAAEDTLRKQTEQLARRLVQNLMKLGLREQIDRAEHLARGGNDMGIAAFLLNDYKSFTAVRYENTALYHLYRAKRDLIKLIQETKNPQLRKKLEQALQGAAQAQQKDQQAEEEQELEELRQQAKQIQRLRDLQKKLNKELEKLAAQKLRSQTQGKPSSPSQAQAQAQAASKENQLAAKADQKAMELARRAQRSPRLPINPAEDMAKAANEMKDAAKALRKDRPDEARDRGKKADRHMKNALREVKRAMERSLAQQLRDAARQARELAQRQQQLLQEAQQLAKAPAQTRPQPGARAQADAAAQSSSKAQSKSQARKPASAAAKPGERKQADAASSKQQTSRSQAKGEPRAQAKTNAARAEALKKQLEQAAKAAAERTPEALAKRQNALRRDTRELGEKLERLADRVKETEPEIAKDVKRLGRDAQAGPAQKDMEQAVRALSQRRLAQAAAPQRQAERRLDQLARGVKEAADQFAMDDEERLARAVQKAEAIAKKQDEINKALKRLASARTKRPAVPKKLADAQKAAKEQTETLARQIDRIRQLQEAGMDEPLQESLQKAAQRMAQAQERMRQSDAQTARRRGSEAKQELDQTAKALRRQMKEALNQKLARALETASKALKAQQSAKAETQRAEQLQKQARAASRAQPRRSARADAQAKAQAQAKAAAQAAANAAQDQAEAKAQTQKLAKDLNAIQRQAQQTHPDMAKDVSKIAREMNARRPLRRMEQAQRALQRKRFRDAQAQQDAAAKALARVRGKLDDLYHDLTSMPLATLKAARDEAEALQKQVQQLQKQERQLQRRIPSRPGRLPASRQAEIDKKLAQLLEQHAQVQDKAERFADRMERLKPDKADLQRLQELKAAMKDAETKLGQRRLKEAMVGHSRSLRALQQIGQGVIKRIERMIAERKRREPMEEHAPDEYKELVRRYYQALSDKTVETPAAKP